MSTTYTKKLGEWGWRIEVQFIDADTDAEIDISSATAMQILWGKLSNPVVSQDAIFVTDGTDGKIQYTTTVNDFTAIGSYAVEAMVTLDTGKILSIESFQIDVIQSLTARVPGN